jgi:hypothetical protein
MSTRSSDHRTIRFELDRLVERTDADIVAEIRRVAMLTDKPVFSTATFARYSRVSLTTVRRRFGTWQDALEQAGLGQLYSGQAVSEKMRRQPARTMTDAELIEELRAVARRKGGDILSVEEIERHSRISAAVLRTRFGSWSNALRAAGLHLSNHGRRYTDDECFENLLESSSGMDAPLASINVP